MSLCAPFINASSSAEIQRSGSRDSDRHKRGSSSGSLSVKVVMALEGGDLMPIRVGIRGLTLRGA